MLSELTRLKDEATRLLTVYEMYKDSEYDYMRRKAHMDIDRFLMENRETAIILMIQGLQDAFDREVEEQKKRAATATPWYKRMIGGKQNAGDKQSGSGKSNRKDKAHQQAVYNEQG